MKYDYHIIVIGGGSGGLVVASGAATLGAKVALIEGDKMGGDCLNTGCVPSKSFLKAAHLAKDIERSKDFGIHAEIQSINMQGVMNHVRHVIKEIEPHDSIERFEGLGVKVFKGYGHFVDAHTIKINDTVITGKNIVIATGSDANVPPIKGLNDVPYLTNKTVFQLDTLPKHLIVLGAGPIGLELGQGFKHLGSQVTIIDQAKQLFSKDDPEVAGLMKDVFTKDGITLKLSAKILEVLSSDDQIEVVIEVDGIKETIAGDQLLVALGRKPNTGSLNLEKSGVKLNSRAYIETNNKLQTNVKHIYACGDVTGPYLFTHMAGYQAGIVIRNTIFKLGAKVNYQHIPWTTYTKPEVAHVGLTEDMAKAENLYADHYLINLSDMDRAKAEKDRQGFLKVIVDKKKRLIGATLVGEKAGEQIPIASLAIKNKMTLSAFMSIIYAYPTEAEIFKFAALDAMKSNFKPWQKKIVTSIFLR